MPKEASISPELQTALTMTGADVAQSELGYTGTGIKGSGHGHRYRLRSPGSWGRWVARQNSTHFPNARVIKGYDLVGDSYNASSTSPVAAGTWPDALSGRLRRSRDALAGIVGASVTLPPAVRAGSPRA
jgi:hypothetical protein